MVDSIDGRVRVGIGHLAITIGRAKVAGCGWPLHGAVGWYAQHGFELRFSRGAGL